MGEGSASEGVLALTQRGGDGGEEETWSRTKKRCCHNLQSGHLAWWSGDTVLCKRNAHEICRNKRNYANFGNQIANLQYCFFRISFFFFGTELAKRKRQSLQLCKFLNRPSV